MVPSGDAKFSRLRAYSLITFFCREELFLVMIMYFGAVISTIELICAGKMSYIVLKTKIGKLFLVLTN